MISQDQYKAVCKGCDHILMKYDSGIWTIGIPWLHVIREHPVCLERYKPLFNETKHLTASVSLPKSLKAALSKTLFFFKSILKESKGDKVQLPSSYNGKLDVLFVSHLLNQSQIGKTNDFYFSDIAEKLQANGIRTAFALIDHITYSKTNDYSWPENSSFRFILPSRRGFLYEAAMVFSALKEGLRLIWKSNNCSDKLLKKIFYTAGIESLKGESILSVRIGRQIQGLVFKYRPSAVVVTYEGHSWERAVFGELSYLNYPVLKIAYQHATIFRLQHAAIRPLHPRYNPDVILTSGQRGYEKLNAISDLKNSSRLAIMGSDRCLESLEVKLFTEMENACVIVPEGEVNECMILFNFSLQCAQQLPEIKFIWRLHPAITFEMLAANGLEISELPGNIYCSSETIEADLSRSKWVLYRGSGASIQATVRGLKPIYLSISEELSIDPIYELDYWKEIVSSSKEFVNLIKKNQYDNNSKGLREKAIAFCTTYYDKLDIKTLLDSLRKNNI